MTLSCELAPQEPTAYYQRYRIRRDATNERADLKDEQARQEDQFDTEELVQLPIQELKGAGRQKVHGPVPSDIVQVLELVCNVRDRGGDDGVVQSDTKDRTAEARERDDEPQSFERLRCVSGFHVHLLGRGHISGRQGDFARCSRHCVSITLPPTC